MLTKLRAYGLQFLFQVSFFQRKEFDLIAAHHTMISAYEILRITLWYGFTILCFIIDTLVLTWDIIIDGFITNGFIWTYLKMKILALNFGML